jgi:hypothetical protein
MALKNCEIIGYSKFTSKKGTDCLICKIAVTPSESDLKFGHVGMKVEEVFVPAECFGLFSPAVIGKTLKRQYEVRGRFANVISVEIV